MAPKKRAPRARRDNGEGSVYPNADGSFTAQVRAADGKLVRRRAPTEQAAEAKRKELIRQRDEGVAIGEGGQSLQTWLNAWFKQKARTKKPKTLAEYQRLMEAYILPALGDVPLDKLKGDRLQALVNRVEDEIKEEGRFDGKRTARAVGAILKDALGLATERRLIPFNPMGGVELPEQKPAKVIPPTEPQIGAFLWHAEGEPLEALWNLYALLGLRRGEGLGVRWQDYDPKARTIRIAQQVQEVQGRLIFGTPKSDAGERLLPLSDRLCSLLDVWRVRQMELKLRRGATWVEHDLIFSTRDGGPLWPRNVEDEFYRLRAWSGLSGTLHHLRHAVATLLDEHGATDALKAEILGHTKETITQRYTAGRLDAMRRVLGLVEVAVLEQKRA